jgi:hypothetical protein
VHGECGSGRTSIARSAGAGGIGQKLGWAEGGRGVRRAIKARHGQSEGEKFVKSSARRRRHKFGKSSKRAPDFIAGRWKSGLAAGGRAGGRTHSTRQPSHKSKWYRFPGKGFSRARPAASRRPLRAVRSINVGRFAGGS